MDLNINYREIINAEFVKRRKSTSFYSLRKFAVDLGLKPMHLSYILRGKRGLSKDNALQVASALGLKSFELQSFRFLVSAQSGRSMLERSLAKQWLKNNSMKNKNTKK
ncbi:MAG: helix-turn-helix domain-containing protein [Bdellovibrionota bacterium]